MNGDMERGESTATKSRLNQLAYYEIDAESRQWTSWLVPMIVVANVVIFVVVMFANNCPQNNLGGDGHCVATFLGRLSFEPLRENPLFGPSSATLVRLGAVEWKKIVGQNQPWRLITCIWIHAGVIQLFANMLSLVVAGIRLEQHFGFIRVGVIYVLSGIGGGVISSLLIHNGVFVGASAAVFGLVGAMLSELLTNWTIYSNKAAPLLTLAAAVAVNLAVGILPHVGNLANAGGFSTGFLLGFVLLARRPQFRRSVGRSFPASSRLKPAYAAYQYVLGILASVLFVVGFTLGLVKLFRGDDGGDSKCRWCHYLSCVPTSKWSCNS